MFNIFKKIFKGKNKEEKTIWPENFIPIRVGNFFFCIPKDISLDTLKEELEEIGPSVKSEVKMFIGLQEFALKIALDTDSFIVTKNKESDNGFIKFTRNRNIR